MDSLLPTSTADLRSLSSFNNRSSPRARRDSPPLLPTVDPLPKRPSSLFSFQPSVSSKSRKELGRGSWIGRWPSSRRLLPWIALFLVWFYIGFRLNIHWSDSSRAVVNQNDSETVLPDDEFTKQSSTESDEIWERAQGHGLAEEVDVDRIDKENGVLENVEQEGEELSIDTTSTTSKREDHLGRDVGPFDALERQMLGGLERNERGSCWKQSRFAKFVRTRSFVMVFHELSMTGAPLAMLELAREIVSCGGKASAVVLNKRGGLYKELGKRGVSIVRDKLTSSWKAAAAADLVVAGSAACNTWIEQYLRHNTKGGERLIWWVMENRREYFDRSKLLLGKAHALVFLSSSQEQLWRQWATEDALVLPSMTKVVSLSVRDDLAVSAGLDDESGTINSFLEAQKKRGMLRDEVRKEMGLLPSDYLVISLSSINPGKGQLLMLQAALMMAEDSSIVDDEGLANNDLTQSVEASSDDPGETMDLQGGEKQGPLDLKILLGSVGSKSNKAEYLEKINELLDTYPSLAEMVLWTEATVHVAALYSAADAYVMNAQGIGETFGRVTVEAMAFGLPVLGTDAGGTKEIVQGNVSGLLHPTGSPGIPILARNLQYLLSHPEIGVEMGKKGRARVQEMYREAPMYDAMASVFLDAEPGPKHDG